MTNHSYPRLLEDPSSERPALEASDPRNLDPRSRDGEEDLHQHRRDLTTARVTRAYRAAAEETGSYGDTVLWSASRGLHLARPALRLLINEAALAACDDNAQLADLLSATLASAMPRELTARLAVPRALERFAQQQRNDGHGALLVRRIKDTTLAGSYALVREVTEDDDLDYHVVCKMTWRQTPADPEGDAEIEVLAHPQWAGDPQDLYDLADYYLTHHTPGDLSEMLVRMIDMADGIGLRSNGGVYFVPTSSHHILDAVMLLIERMDGHCGRFPVPRVETNTDFLVFAVGERLLQDVRDLEREVGKREETAKRAEADASGKCRGVAQATVDAYMARAAELRVKAERYMDLLDFNATGVRSGVSALETRLQALGGRAENPFAGLDEEGL